MMKELLLDLRLISLKERIKISNYLIQRQWSLKIYKVDLK